MTPESEASRFKETAKDVQLRVIGAVVKQAIGTAEEKPEEWNRSVDYIEQALLEVERETEKRVREEYTDLLKNYWTLLQRFYDADKEWIGRWDDEKFKEQQKIKRLLSPSEKNTLPLPKKEEKDLRA